MPSEKKIVVQFKVNHKGDPLSVVDSLFSNTVKPDLVFLDMSSVEYPNRTLDLPAELVEYVRKNPKVKFMWDGKNPLSIFDGYQIIHMDLDNIDAVMDELSGRSTCTNTGKIVVAMTSWKNRIQNCTYVIGCLLKNTLPPDMVFLSLSTEEFPNLQGDLPSDLVDLCTSNQNVKLNWVTGPNTKSMKKVYPILPFLEDDDMIILCDDDFDIPENFIQVRVDEFKEHRCMFPISGGTNPKWHLNLPLYHTRYNSLAATSIFSKKMIAGYSDIWSKEIIETYKDDTIHTMLCLSNGYYPIPSKYLSTYCGVTEQKIPLYNEVDGMKNNRQWKSDKETISIFVRKFNENPSHTFKQSLFNLVLFDSFDVAGDNAEMFYRIARQKYPWLNMTFLISRTCSEWDRLEKDGFRLYPIDGADVGELMKNASYILWSKDTSQFKHLYMNKAKSIFLSHGRTHRMYDCSQYYTNRLSKCVSYVVCTSDEEAASVQEYSSSRVKTLVTGFPRHDIVLDRSREREWNLPPDHRKQVLIAFHYRPYDIYPDIQTLKDSDYLKGVKGFLNSEEIRSLSNDMDIVFMPHVRYREYLGWFEVPDYIKVCNDSTFQDVFVQSDFLVTDFSSTSFEFAYMDKPAFMYVPDKECVSRTMKQYHMENVSKYPHLMWCDTVGDVVSGIRKHWKEDVKGFIISDKMFKYHDTCNTERLLAWMFERYGI